jgi:hypothetical protein
MTFDYQMEKDNGDLVSLEITYNISGSYRPATRLEPEEWPELEVQTITDAVTSKEVELTDAEYEEVKVKAEEHYQEWSDDEDDRQADYECEIQRERQLLGEEW